MTDPLVSSNPAKRLVVQDPVGPRVNLSGGYLLGWHLLGGEVLREEVGEPGDGWPDARTAVAALRMEAAEDPDDPELAVLVGELSVQDADFRTWWATHQVSGASYGAKHYRHPLVGDLTLDCDVWDSPDGSGQRLMVLTAEPGTPSYERLRILASWNAEPHISLGTERPSAAETDA